MTSVHARSLWALLVGAAFAACSSNGESPGESAAGSSGAAGFAGGSGSSGTVGSSGAESDGGTAGTSGAAGDAGAVVAVPDTAAGRQLAWVLDLINARGGAASDEELAAHFSESFLAQVPSATIVGLFASLAAQDAPFTLVELGAEATDAALLATVVGRDGQRALVRLNVDATGLIEGLLISPDLETGKPRSWDEVDADVAALAPLSSYLVARVEGTECTPLHAARSDERLAIGSTFKLYVLAELSRQIEAATLGWDSTLTIRDALKSLPSGQLQDLPDGTELSLLDVATPMIAISDNTAADHLIDRLGRENVESALGAFGHGAPALNTPFLSTRELFLFKLDLEDTAVDAYLAADVAGRRAFLDGLAGRAPNIDNAEQWVAPRRIEQLEWFASTGDLCKVMAALDVRAEQPGLEPLATVLTANPGIPFDTAAFPYVAYKGGSEPGVLHLSWLVHAATGARYFVSLGFNDTTAPIDEDAPLPIAVGIFDLLASGD